MKQILFHLAVLVIAVYSLFWISQAVGLMSQIKTKKQKRDVQF
jgi:hypothetical protein